MFIRLYPDSEKVMTTSPNKLSDDMFGINDKKPINEAKEDEKSVLKFNEDEGLYYEYIPLEGE